MSSRTPVSGVVGRLAWCAPRGHLERLEGLWRAAADGRLPHALLFTGPEGIGKYLSARWLALGLLCETGPGPPCAACGPCKRAMSANHPDLLLVDAPAVGQDRITVAFVTPRLSRSENDYDGVAIGEFLSLRPMEGGWRIVLMREVERMNEQAQNAFLKTLEEPGAQTLLVLESATPDRLLDTVRSRVVTVGLQPLVHEDTWAVLAEQGWDASSAELLTRWCAGAPGRGLRLAQRAAPAMREILCSVLGQRTGAPQAAAEVWELEGDFPAKTPVASRRLRAATLLDVCLEVALDLVRLAAGAPPQTLPHGDIVALLPPLGRVALERLVECWMLARRDVAWNPSPEVLVDRTLAAAAAAAAQDSSRHQILDRQVSDRQVPDHRISDQRGVTRA